MNCVNKMTSFAHVAAPGQSSLFVEEVQYKRHPSDTWLLFRKAFVQSKLRFTRSRASLALDLIHCMCINVCVLERLTSDCRKLAQCPDVNLKTSHDQPLMKAVALTM